MYVCMYVLMYAMCIGDVYVCMHVFLYTDTQVCWECACTLGGQRLVLGILLNGSSFYFLWHVLFLNPELTDSSGIPAPASQMLEL